MLGEINPLNAKRKIAEIETFLNKYIPGAEGMKTRLKKYSSANKQLKTDNATLTQKVEDGKESIVERLETLKKLQELDDLKQIVKRIPKEILDTYKPITSKQQIQMQGEGRDA